MISAVLALILRIISNPFANFLQKKLATSYSSIMINCYVYFVLFICSVFYLIVSSTNIFNYNCYYWFLVLSSGLLCTLGSISLIKALELGEMSVLAPINSYKCLVGLFGGIIFLGEFPLLKEFLGLVLIIFGSVFVFGTLKDVGKFNLFKRKDIFLRFCALFCSGIEAVILKKIILLSSPILCFCWWCISGFIFSIVLMIIFKKEFKSINNIEILNIFGIAIGLGIMQLSTNIVFKYINVGLSLALFQMSGVIGVMMGYFFFKERNIVKKLIGSIIMIIGSCLIIK